MKDKIKGLGVCGVFFGMWLSRNFGDNYYFGLNARVIIGIICILCMFPLLIWFVLKRHYIMAFLNLIFICPFVLGFVGIYYNNMNLLLVSIILFFIILSIGIILIKRYQKNKDSINYDRYKNN